MIDKLEVRIVKYTNCDRCPCLNSGYDDAYCNLGYSTDLEWFRKSDKIIVKDTPEMRKHQKDFDLDYISFDCGLVSIATNDKVFYQNIITYVSEELYDRQT